MRRLCVLCCERPVGRRGTDLCIRCLKAFGSDLPDNWLQSEWFKELVSMQRSVEYRESQAPEIINIDDYKEIAVQPIEPVGTIEDVIENVARNNPTLGSAKLLTALQSLGYTTSRSTVARVMRRMKEDVAV